jgi:hypothetical protein
MDCNAYLSSKATSEAFNRFLISNAAKPLDDRSSAPTVETLRMATNALCELYKASERRDPDNY